MKKIINDQRIDSRKSIAKCEKAMSNSQPDLHAALIKIIAIERDFLKKDFSKTDQSNVVSEIIANRHDKIKNVLNSNEHFTAKFAEMMPSVPGAPDVYVRPESIPTFDKLLNVLEQNLNDEKSTIMNDNSPSANDIKRWALKNAVLEYYRGLNIPADKITTTKVTNAVGDMRAVPELAPNKNSIYNIWIQKLDAQSKAQDKYKLSFDEYNESVERGIPRGGAFEKMLDRYREQFMSQLWQKHNEEVKNARN